MLLPLCNEPCHSWRPKTTRNFWGKEKKIREMSSWNQIFTCRLPLKRWSREFVSISSFIWDREDGFISPFTHCNASELLLDGSLCVEPTNDVLLSDQSTSISASCHVTSYYYVSPARDQGPLISVLGTAAKTRRPGTPRARRVLVCLIITSKNMCRLRYFKANEWMAFSCNVMDGRLLRWDSRDARARTSIDTSALSDVPATHLHTPGIDSPPPSEKKVS